jgi:gliding motility-associated-like protein
LNLLFFTLITRSQNLVPNPSFEDYVTCPYQAEQVAFCTGWYQPTLGSSDFYNSCAGSIGVGIPNNFAGHQNAFHGEAYMGLSAYFIFDNWNYQEYIQCQILNTLETGQTYRIRFYASLADFNSSSSHAVDMLGAWVSNGPYIDTFTYNAIDTTPTITAGYYLDSFDEWMRVEGYFTATGNETHLTIGAFINPNNYAGAMYMQPDEGAPISYYYIDSVSLVKHTIPSMPCDTATIELPNVFTPNGDGINDTWTPQIPECIGMVDEYQIFNRWGNEVFFGTEETHWSGEAHSTGTYFYWLRLKNNTIKTGTLHLFR